MQTVQQWAEAASLAELSAFVSVAERRSFKQAARLLGRDPTVLSRRIDALERRVGVRLLERTTRKVSLNEAGAMFLERARPLLALLHDAEQELRSHADDEPRGTLRLALPSTFARMWITPALPELLGAHPGLRIECALSNRYVDLVREGFDAAVRIGELTHASLVARRLAARERVFCAAPSYLAQRGTPRHPDELRAHDTLLFTGAAGYPAWRLINRRGDKLSLRLQGRYVSDDAEALRDAALAGQGIVMAADWLVGRELLEGRLVRILPSWTTIDRAAIYSVVPSRLVARKTRVFLDWITKRLAEPPWLAR